MNKFGFAAIFLVVASACLVSAAPNKIKEGLEHVHGGHKHHGGHDGGLHKVHHEGHGEHHLPGLNVPHIPHRPHYVERPCHCEHQEYNHGQEHGNYGHHGGHGVHGGHSEHGSYSGHGSHGFGKHGLKGRSGSPSFASDVVEKNKSNLRVHDDERERIHQDGNRFNHKQGAKGVIAGHVNKDHHEDTGIKKHQKVATDKTIIVDKGTAVNDVEVNRHAHDSKHAGGFAVGAAGSKTESVHNNFDADRERDHDLESQTSQFREREFESDF